MTDREPVDIMGVFAFPNPDKDKRDIRFIDSVYRTLFTIKDGESIVINRFDGEKMVLPCKYIDDCHVCVGNSAYHICEFAEMQERSGNTYVPRTPKISAERGNSLEDLWAKHNRDSRPFAHRMRSMSVSDIVVLTQGGKKTAYYTDSVGFKEVPEFLAQQRVQKKHKERGEAR